MTKPAKNTGGGHGGISFSDGFLTKPTSKKEVATFRLFKQSVDEDTRKTFLPPIPEDFEVDETTIRLGDITYGMADARVMDIKIGFKTVSKTELKESGVGFIKRNVKKRKLKFADWYTKSSTRGYRVVSAAGVQGTRQQVARMDLAVVLAIYFGVSPHSKDNTSPEAKARLKAAFSFLMQLKELHTSEFVTKYRMIAASVLNSFDMNDPDRKGGCVMKLIDFAHTDILPEEKGSAKYANYQKFIGYFSRGLSYLIVDVTNFCKDAGALDPQA